MIKTTKESAAELIAGRCPKAFEQVRRTAERKLQMLDAAENLDDLRSPPGNRLEQLHGDREGQHSIRVNGRFRVCFRWENGDAYDVEVIDYH